MDLLFKINRQKRKLRANHKILIYCFAGVHLKKSINVHPSQPCFQCAQHLSKLGTRVFYLDKTTLKPAILRFNDTHTLVPGTKRYNYCLKD